MSTINPDDSHRAFQEFRNARWKANLEALLDKMSGKQTNLLSFEEVKKYLNLSNPGKSYLTDIPIDSIVGSVGRYYEFNRRFRPLRDSNKNRWTKIRELVEGQEGLPPIEAYKVGNIYFVIDGNHRVSVARQIGSNSIEAYVKEFRTKAPLTSDDDLEDVILKEEFAEMMEATMLDQVAPDYDFILTIPGRYTQILEQICNHRYYMDIEQGREVSMREASASWVENIYSPVVKVINDLNILEDFPGRTETDLYLWLSKHQVELRECIGEEVETVEVAEDFTKSFSRRPGKIFSRFFEELFNFINLKNRKSR